MRMSWTASLDPRYPVIETTFSGRLSPADLGDAFEAIRKLVFDSGRSLVLADCTALQGGHSVTDLYHLAETFAKVTVQHPVKEAVLLSEMPNTAGMARFWETTCYNRGINVRAFADRNGALAWLMDGECR